MDLNLASPATGAMQEVWFSADGSTLYARTAAGKVYATADFDTWRPAVDAPEPPEPGTPVPVVRLPEPGARVVVAFPYSYQFAIGRHLSRSDDGGYSWTNLTAYKAQSVVGFGQRSVAVSPTNPDQIALANDNGVWRSMDGGLSWTGLNLSLPNLAVRRILSTPTGASGVRVLADGMGPLELPPSGTVWEPAPGVRTDDEALLAEKYSRLLAADIAAVVRVRRHRDGGLHGRANLVVPGRRQDDERIA